MHMRRILPGIILLVACLFITVTVGALPLKQIPNVPHPIEGREDCLICHGPGQPVPFPNDHEGRESDTCLLCHQVSPARPAPALPHPIEKWNDCLSCHDTGQVRPFPEDHEGRENDVCLQCHEESDVEEGAPQPTPTPTATLPPPINAVPTPIVEPILFAENSCITCHEQLDDEHKHLTVEWSESIHASRGVGCVSCHGGDPSQPDAAAAMSKEAGYLGPIPRDRTPALCASCHSRVDLMRQYNLATDQFDQYWESRHGQALMEGDSQVATCFDCHGGHRVLQVSDPESGVYPGNEPAMCAGCHADSTTMSAYDIPTDQYESYQTSVHGMALARQDQRAPTCSTCHGKHGAAPPGFQQVGNVCGQCHAGTEDYYLQGAHRLGMVDDSYPRCVTCHGQHDVTPASRELYTGTAERHCGECHEQGTDTGDQVDDIYQALKGADDAFEQAEALIAVATERRLLMEPQEEQLQRGMTPLIESRAMQHTANVEEIQAKAGESLEISQQVQKSVEEALKGLETRRIGMIVAVAVILITVAALILIKLQLDRDLEAERARRRNQMASSHE